MKRLAFIAVACLLLSGLAQVAQAHGRGGFGFSINLAPPPPPPCYHYPPPPCYGPYGCGYPYYHYAPRPWYGPPRSAFWFGF
jgi:hypothetical protein